MHKYKVRLYLDVEGVEAEADDDAIEEALSRFRQDLERTAVDIVDQVQGQVLSKEEVSEDE